MKEPSKMAFALHESLQHEMERIDMLRATNPVRAAEIMNSGKKVHELVAKGDLRELWQFVATIRQGDIPYWFIVRSYQQAAINLRLDILKFFTDNGFDLKTCKPCRNLLHRVLETSTGVQIQRIVTFLIQQGLDVNYQRDPDFFTPLHVACACGNTEAIHLLIALGADVNAVAKVMEFVFAKHCVTQKLTQKALDLKTTAHVPVHLPSQDETMPLTLARMAFSNARSTDKGSERSNTTSDGQLAIEYLISMGAQDTWRTTQKKQHQIEVHKWLEKLAMDDTGGQQFSTFTEL